MESTSKNKTIADDLEPFRKTDEKPASSRAELLDEFDLLLSNHQLDNKITKRYLTRERLPRLLAAIFGVAMCVTAVVLILMPPASHDNTMKYILASTMLVAGVYLAVRFAL
ncbi:MAG: hypothetical protein ACHQHN_03145 [Sphingobacteriales bacterium]